MTTTRKTRPYRDVRMARLSNPTVAAAYLNATMKNSPENFLAALKNVAQARKMATVAKDAGVQRETLYRSLSEQGNPTYDTFVSVLSAVGISLDFVPSGQAKPSSVTSQRPPIVAASTLGTNPEDHLRGGAPKSESGLSSLFIPAAGNNQWSVRECL